MKRFFEGNKMNWNTITLKIIGIAITALVCTGCGTISGALNPFQAPIKDEALQGTPSDHALKEEGNRLEKARASLEEVSRYPKAHQPQPVNPVIQPAVVRLMWVPDHLNGSGDLVPAHYYYLKVLEDRWAVTDVFEKQKLSGGSGLSDSGIPYTRSAR